MKGELTAILEKAPESGYWAICPEIPGANGQGETIEEAKENLKAAVILILEDRLEDVRRRMAKLLTFGCLLSYHVEYYKNV